MKMKMQALCWTVTKGDKQTHVYQGQELFAKGKIAKLYMKIMQMARFESISPIKIGLNVTEYESTLTHGNRAECETIHCQNM